MGFDLAQRGYSVMLCEHPEFIRNIENVAERGGIEAVDSILGQADGPRPAMSGFAKLTATTDIRMGVEYADILFMILPSFAQEIFFQLVMPHLRDGQIIVLLPGNFGSLVCRKMMKEAGIRKDVVFAETNTIPYACRMIEPGKVFILAVKQGIGIASFPGSEIDGIVDTLKGILHLKLISQNNVVQVGLNNPNMVVHPATAVLNMGIAESRKGAFYFYREGMSESVSKVQQAIENERMDVTEALGLGRDPFSLHLKNFYNLDFSTIREFAESSPIHSSFGHDAPKSPRDRYVTEDCPYLLVPLYEFGRLLGIETPATRSIITLASIYNDTDYFQAGRTLSKLGLEGMNGDQILGFIQ